MNKSLDFLKQRIASGQCNGMENNTYDTMSEYSTVEWMNNRISQSEDNTWNLTLTGQANDKEINVKVDIVFDDNTEFDYFTMDRCCCDGTLMFYSHLIENIFKKIAGCETYCTKSAPEDLLESFEKYNRKYTIGNFVLANEYSDEFSTEEKPWMKNRFSVMLPIKCEFIKKQ